ncbi:wd repeat protein [Diplodia corticola]|uniref:WD repeat-containing protein JIP5 n=1 Tax=Diplodia corticola TaxID=236234 RepID=A0A1J9R8V1_9PEZI|nr:wd repeat protein [Diplodia corticola]OJD37000.1 wd repeat protein [Diplodia corticola]
MFDTICNLPLSSDLFAQAIHPTEPLVAVGLSAGHVQTFRLPPVATDDDDNSSVEDAAAASENGFGQIETAWRTRRHKGSCRSLAYSVDGEALYSAGTDGLVKAASSETGQVLSKINVPRIGNTNTDIDAPSLLHVLSPQTLLLATDSSPLHLFDLRADHSFPSLRAAATHHPHDDYVSSLTPLPASAASTSGFSKQWVTTGGATLAVTDLRRGVLVRSEDQGEELLSSLFVGGLGRRGTSVGEKVLVGGSGGVVTLWERGVWDDQDERVTVDRGAPGAGGGESVDVLAAVPEGVGASGKVVAVGLGNGLVRFVRIGSNRVIGEISHDETGESVVALGFDVGGRLITGGGQVVKVWHEGYGGSGDDDDGEEDATEGAKRSMDSDDDDDSDDDSDADSSDDGGDRKRRKKRKRSKGKDQTNSKAVVTKFSGLD